MNTSLLRTKVIQEIDQIPASKLPEVFTFLHYFRLGLERSMPSAQPDADRILQFAGSWNDLPEQEFVDFLNEMQERRSQAFSQRPSREASFD